MYYDYLQDKEEKELSQNLKKKNKTSKDPYRDREARKPWRKLQREKNKRKYDHDSDFQ